MNWLFEQGLMIVIIGMIVVLGLGALWSGTGRNAFLYAAGAALLLMIVGLVVERLVVTDKEAIRQTLLEIARDVKTNDRRAVLRHIHSSRPELKRKAEGEMPRYQFTECRVTRIHLIDVDGHAQPRSAVVEFNVIASGTFKYEGVELTETVPRWVRLHMLQEKDGRWTVEDYEHAPPQQMMYDKPIE